MLFQRLFAKASSGPDPRVALRPLWHKVVQIARDPAFYRDDGVADTVAGRFDMITAVLSVVLLRMERDRVLVRESAFLTELFVEDMDGQLRESGVGDMVVGKRMGKLVSVLGGRLGALREALPDRQGPALQAALARNVTMIEGREPDALARRLRAFADKVAALDSKALLAGDLAL
jgi:cytochrome b pre-mRNA-processing protein 3